MCGGGGGSGGKARHTLFVRAREAHTRRQRLAKHAHTAPDYMYSTTITSITITTATATICRRNARACVMCRLYFARNICVPNRFGPNCKRIRIVCDLNDCLLRKSHWDSFGLCVYEKTYSKWCFFVFIVKKWLHMSTLIELHN